MTMGNSFGRSAAAGCVFFMGMTKLRYGPPLGIDEVSMVSVSE